MSRFSFIPLDYANLTKGLEREVVIKKDTNDIYILDDYKIPVSATKTLKDDTSNLENNVSIIVNKSENLVLESKRTVDRVIQVSNILDTYVERAEGDLIKRINGLHDYQVYLDSVTDEVSTSFTAFKKTIEDMVNNYYEDLSNILNDVQSKYDKNNTLYNKYVGYKNDYDKYLTTMEAEIKKLKEELKLKLQKLGSGSGSYNSTITVTKPVTRTGRTWFRWLSNSSTIYPGNRTAGSFSDGGWWGNYSNAPCKPNGLVTSDPVNGENRHIDGITVNKSNFSESNLTSWKWYQALEDSGTTVSKQFLSDTGIRNRYGRKVECTYSKSFTESVNEDIHIDL